MSMPMIEKLLGWDFQARVANPCIGADRADLVLGRLRHPGSDPRASGRRERLRVADRGLREGMLSELMAEEGVWRSGSRGGAAAMNKKPTKPGAGAARAARRGSRRRAA